MSNHPRRLAVVYATWLCVGTAFAEAPQAAEPETVQSEPEPGSPTEEAATAAAAPPVGRAPWPRRRPYLYTLSEELLFLAGGATWYWTDRDFNRGDWDYDSWKRRFSRDAFRYDNNAFSTNWVFHPLAGSAFHAFPRIHGFRFGGALGIAFATSTTWEGLIEFREKFSLNDLVATPGAGAPLGDFFHHLGEYLFHVHAPRGRPLHHRVLAWTLGFPTRVVRAIDRIEPDPSLAPLFDPQFRMAFSTESWQVRGLPVKFVQAVTLEAELGDYRSIGGLGPRMRRFHDGNRVTFRLRSELVRGRPGVDLLADVVALGGIRREGGGDTGAPMHETSVGLAIGYVYQRREWSVFRDQFSLLEIPSLAVDHRTDKNGFVIRARMRAAPALGAAYAPGYRRWLAAHPDVQGKTILDNWDYYNAWGGVLRGEMSATHRRFELGSRVSLTWLSSVEGLDRFQERITRDQPADERRLTWSAYARARPFPVRGMHVGMEFHGIESHARIDGLRTYRQFVSLGLSLGGEL